MATSVIIVPNGRLYKGDIVLYGEFAELAKHQLSISPDYKEDYQSLYQSLQQ